VQNSGFGDEDSKKILPPLHTKNAMMGCYVMMRPNPKPQNHIMDNDSCHPTATIIKYCLTTKITVCSQDHHDYILKEYKYQSLIEEL
jgi:hypothetical protein